ncbi:HDOD domain-containing protein [uncultured Paludibaculum sp.]|uniref:HDOD domain-containing protein n=1 Tax=uncultured Paludibaculum sp. TaxID=1765020 RepID=UPI002AAB1365|nr:HDOD domain-containing protein [uncultured Paludibaculum sp.]
MSPSILHRVSFRDRALRSLDKLPPFSPVLNHLIASLADDDVSFARLADVIERDTVLSGNILRLVNSALYGRRGMISSVRAAVLMLGISKLRNYLLGLSVSRMWATVATPPGWSTARFNDHSVSAAILSDLLVQKTKADFPEGAFVAGLLHDLGRMMIAIALPAEFERIQNDHAETGKPLEVIEHELLDVTHSELSAAALTRWNLPLKIQKAVLYHHRSAIDPTVGAHGPMALSLMVETANALANGSRHGITDTDEKLCEPANEAMQRLGLVDAEAGLMVQFEAELQAVRSQL